MSFPLAPAPQPAATAPAGAATPAQVAQPAATAAQTTQHAGTASQAVEASAPAFPSGTALAGPIALLLVLAAAALLFSRRRRAPSRRIQIVETTALGPRKSLVLARLGDEFLLLGATDAGISLLRTQPAPQAAPAALPAAANEAPRAAPGPGGETSGALVELAARLLPGRHRAEAPARSPAFEALLAESGEDQELRRKLALGRSGSVR